MTSSRARPGSSSRPPAPARRAPIRLSDPAGVVAAVPYLLGHPPSRSLVVVGLRDGGQVGPVLRLDLPAGTQPPEVPDHRVPRAQQPHEVAERVLHALLVNGCERAVVTLHVDADPPAGPGDDALLVLAAVESGVDVLDVVHVGPSRFRSLRCPDTACCAAEGLDVSAVRHHPVAAGFVLAGRSPVAARDLVEAPVTVDATEARQALAAAAAGRGRPRSPQERRRLLRQWVEVVTGPRPRALGPDLAGRLAAGWADDVRLRDACGLACLPGGPAAAGLVLRGTAESGSSLRDVLADPGCGGALTEASWAFRRLSALAPAPDRPAVDACHAWLAWVSGDGTVAGVLADRVLTEVPDHGLALLVRQCLDRAVGPPWVTAGG